MEKLHCHSILQIWKWCQGMFIVNIKSRLWISGDFGNIGKPSLSGSHPIVIEIRSEVGSQPVGRSCSDIARRQHTCGPWKDNSHRAPGQIPGSHPWPQDHGSLRTSWTRNVSHLTRRPEVEWSPGWWQSVSDSSRTEALLHSFSNFFPPGQPLLCAKPWWTLLESHPGS